MYIYVLCSVTCQRATHTLIRPFLFTKKFLPCEKNNNNKNKGWGAMECDKKTFD